MVSGLPSIFPGGEGKEVSYVEHLRYISHMLLCVAVPPQPFTDEELGFGRAKVPGTGHTAGLGVGSAVFRPFALLH